MEHLQPINFQHDFFQATRISMTVNSYLVKGDTTVTWDCKSQAFIL